MEKITIYTRSMLQVMRPIVDQVELFSSYTDNSDSEEFPKPEIEDICNPLLQLKNSCFSKDVMQLKVSLRDFYDAVDLMKRQKVINDKMKNIMQQLIWNVYNFLVKKDSVAVESIKSVIKKCMDDFSKFVNNDAERKQHLKAFVENAVACLKQVRDRIEDLINKKHRQQLLLSVRQIAKCVPLLVSALNLTTHADQIQLEKAVENSTGTFQHNIECGGQFVQKMDIALDIMSSDLKGCNEELKVAIDEVLCHAMSIAHVAVDADRNNISRSCQKVLRAFEELKQKHAKELPPMQELLVGALTESLERLEQQVNSALLQLVLEVFSTLFLPLKRLLEAGDGPHTLIKRTSEDLDDDIAVFDLLMDRIMQIGLFAVACSQDTHRVVGICGCLASLESLEPELVPALIALYLDPESSAHRTYLQVLVRHWQQEVVELQVLLNGIVDPAAFCEVTLQDVSHIVATIKGKLFIASPQFLKLQVGTVLKKTAILQQQISISLKEEHGDVLPPQLQQPVKDFILSRNELNAASELFLCEKHANYLTEEERKRLLKRCELLVSMTKRIHPLLIDVTGNTSKDNTNAPKEETGKEKGRNSTKGSTLLFPDSLRDVPVDLDSQIYAEELSCVKNNFTDLMKRGKALAKDRSIPYCTPKKKWEHSVKLMNLRIPQIRNRSIFNCTNYAQESSVDQTLGLEITKELASAYVTKIKQNLSRAISTLQRSDIHKTCQIGRCKGKIKSRNVCMHYNKYGCGLCTRNTFYTSARCFEALEDILENLTSLSDTLSSGKLQHDISSSKSSLQKNTFAVVCEAAAFSDCGVIPTSDSFLSSLKSPTITGSTFDMRSFSHEVDTLERIEDLKTVKEKIASLKANST